MLDNGKSEKDPVVSKDKADTSTNPLSSLCNVEHVSSGLIYALSGGTLVVRSNGGCGRDAGSLIAVPKSSMLWLEIMGAIDPTSNAVSSTSTDRLATELCIIRFRNIEQQKKNVDKDVLKNVRCKL